MIDNKTPSVRDSLVQALGGMVPNGQMQGGAASGSLPAWMQTEISKSGGTRPLSIPQVNPKPAAPRPSQLPPINHQSMAALGSSIGGYSGGGRGNSSYGQADNNALSYNPMTKPGLGQYNKPLPSKAPMGKKPIKKPGKKK